MRRDTDCRDVDGTLTLLTDFYPSEYSEQTLRLRKIEKLSKGASRGLLRHFLAYREEWNRLVHRDRSGASIRASDRTSRDYVHRRKLATHPLRVRSWSRTISIPVSPEIKAELKQHLQLDWRRVGHLRLLRFGRRVALSYVIKEVRVREVDLDERTIRSCRDPRLHDVGICFDQHGMSVVVKNPTDDLCPQHFPKRFLDRQFIDSILTELVGKARVVALDPAYPAELHGIASYFRRKLRTLQAEGAIEFKSPKLVSLGERYRNLPRCHPQHLKLSMKRHMREHFDYCIFMRLTGQPLLVKVLDGNVVDVDGRHVNPLERANHAVQSVMAKLDLWHGATFLHSVNSQRVRKAFHRYRCERQKAASC